MNETVYEEDGWRIVSRKPYIVFECFIQYYENGKWRYCYNRRGLREIEIPSHIQTMCNLMNM